MNEWLKVAKKYWRALVLVFCLLLMNSAYGQSWGVSTWKAPDHVTIHTDKYGVETSRETTQIGMTYFNGVPINSSVEAISRILLVVIVLMYWRQVRRKIIAIPYGVLAALMLMYSSSGYNNGQFTFALFVMGIVIFTKKRISNQEQSIEG